MIQHNRGGQLDPKGRIVRLTGTEGATLYLLSIPDDYDILGYPIKILQELCGLLVAY